MYLTGATTSIEFTQQVILQNVIIPQKTDVEKKQRNLSIENHKDMIVPAGSQIDYRWETTRFYSY